MEATVIELTESEKKLIALKREEDALQAKKEALKKEQELEKRKVDNEKSIQIFLNYVKEKNQKTDEYFQKLRVLDFKFTLKITEKIKDYSICDYNHNKNSEKVIIQERKVPYTDLQIMFDNKFEIEVVKHTVYSGRYSQYTENKGYKMSLPNVITNYKDYKYTSAKKVYEKLTDYINAEQRKNNQMNEKEQLFSEAMTMLPIKFEKTKEIKKGYSGKYDSRGKYSSVDTIDVYFTNGNTLQLRPYRNAEQKVGFAVVKMELKAEFSNDFFNFMNGI